MGYEKRDSAKKYTPADGDTLKSIAEGETAAGNPMTWQDIARFNWGTDDPNVADEFLRDELGCYVRAKDKRFMFAADVEVRTPLLIPIPFKKSGLSTTRTHTIKVRKKEKPPKQFESCTRVEGITFEFDSDKIRESETADLARVAAKLQEHPDAKAMIFGHTDKVGSETYNKGLSERRAKSVFTFLTTKSGVDASRFMEPKHMGCGEFNPVKDTEAAHEPNRRVTVFLFNPDRLPNLPCAHGDISPCNKQKGAPLPRHKDSFHCSFYDSLAKNCPLEGGTTGLPVKSTLLIVNEIGEPLKNTPVKVILSDGSEIKTKTSTDGKIELERPEGEKIEVEVEDVHEFEPTDSAKTGSGQHFAANEPGPRGGSGGS
jgi:outer membrane protein OmpA-like peptidoglycan-associated protein